MPVFGCLSFSAERSFDGAVKRFSRSCGAVKAFWRGCQKGSSGLSNGFGPLTAPTNIHTDIYESSKILHPRLYTKAKKGGKQLKGNR